MSRCIALIPAAGQGSRVGLDRPKQYLTLLGKPMLAHCVDVLANHPRISTVFVVIAPDDQLFDSFDWSEFGDRVQVVRTGGSTRSESVSNGLQALGDEAGANDWILVHDAARPCLSVQLLDRLLDGVADDSVGGLLACRIADTLKSEDEQKSDNTQSRVSTTRSRDGLWGAQTPQMFRRSLLEQALSESNSEQVTDESSAIERLGYQPLLIESDAENLKVTISGDLNLAEAILIARKGSQ